MVNAHFVSCIRIMSDHVFCYFSYIGLFRSQYVASSVTQGLDGMTGLRTGSYSMKVSV